MGTWNKVRRWAGAAAVLLAAGAAPGGTAQAQTAIPVPGPTVAAIKARGALACGVDTGIPGFAFQDSKGTWKGFDVAYCRAHRGCRAGRPREGPLRPDNDPCPLHHAPGRRH